MTIAVAAFCSYLTRPVASMRDADFSAQKFVKAVKGEQLRGYGSVPVRGVRHRLDERSASDVADWFALWAVDQLDALRAQEAELLLVPIPSSAAVVGSPAVGPPWDLAGAVERAARRLGRPWRVFDGLRWRRALPRSREEGGTRDPEMLLKALAPLPPSSLANTVCVAIDDVYTTGGHIQAACAALTRAGATAPMALCAGSTYHHQLDDPFSLPIVEIAEIG